MDPDRAPPAAGADRRCDRGRPGVHDADGRRGRAAAGLHREQRAAGGEHRRLMMRRGRGRRAPTWLRVAPRFCDPAAAPLRAPLGPWRTRPAVTARLLGRDGSIAATRCCSFPPASSGNARRRHGIRGTHPRSPERRAARPGEDRGGVRTERRPPRAQEHRDDGQPAAFEMRSGPTKAVAAVIAWCMTRASCAECASPCLALKPESSTF